MISMPETDKNRDYPDIGNYILLNNTIYDRIKREYPPINETIKNLRYPPKIMDEKQRRELEKLL